MVSVSPDTLLTQTLSVIGDKHDQCLIPHAQIIEECECFPKVVIVKSYFAVVGANLSRSARINRRRDGKNLSVVFVLKMSKLGLSESTSIFPDTF